MHVRIMGLLKVVFLNILLYTIIIAQEDSELYRLPNTIKPERYVIQLALDDEFYDTKQFTGSVDITVVLSEDTNTIILHSATISYTPNKISILEEPDNTVTYDFEEEYQKMILTTATQLQAGTYTIRFQDYIGTLHEDMYGFYLSEYENADGETEYLATTQLQSVYARRAFPCFDEPNFKATFVVSITRPSDYIALGNTRIASTTGNTDTFEETPPMSTYLLAFIVSKFKGYGLQDGTERLQYDVWCRGEALDTADYSYGIGRTILENLGNHLGIDYYTMTNVEKMDQVAIPDFSAGAMENWGLVTYRETALLWDTVHSTASSKQRIATVIAHEFAHMWFGNLVTLDWWEYTWLNEGFARYYQYRATAQVQQDWELEKQFVIEQQQVIFGSDALDSAAALNSGANRPSEISSKFSSISYNKGASVITMMVNFLGDENYITGIRSYLVEHSYGNSVPEDLYAALSTNAPILPATLSEIMTTWTEQPGFPVVTVTRNESGLSFSQERFLLNSASTSSLTWYVPITYTTETEPNFADTSDIHWLLPTEELFIESENSEGWIVANLLETGYYRVNYDDDLWTELETALKAENFATIFPDLNRAQIVDDALNLARASILPYDRALNITFFLENEVSYYPWYAAFNAFSFLMRRIDSSEAAGEYLPEHISALMTNLYEDVSFDITTSLSHIETLKTALTLQWACQLGNADCLEKASALFAGLEDSGTEINPNLRSTVYCSAIREDDTGARWEFLWNRFQETKLASEQTTIITALGCSKDETILNNYLGLSIDESSSIRKQDGNSVFSAVLAGNPGNVDIAFAFLKENIETIVEFYDGMNALSSVITGIADRLTTQEQIDEFEAFIEEQGEGLNDAAVAAQTAIESAKANLQWAESNLEELNAWFEATYGSAASVTLSVTVFVISLVTVLLNF